jgi:hypothetical protein
MHLEQLVLEELVVVEMEHLALVHLLQVEQQIQVEVLVDKVQEQHLYLLLLEQDALAAQESL